MANPTLLLTFTQNLDGVTGVIADVTTTYGGGNPTRVTLGNYLLWSKNDKAGTRSYTNPSSNFTAPHSVANWTVDTSVDGWHQATIISVLDYSGATPYVPRIINGQGVVTQYEDIVYYDTTKKWYKNILGVTGTAPDAGSGATYWTEITDFSILLPNTKVNKTTISVQINIKTDTCIKDGFYKKIDACGCKLTFKEMEAPMRSYFLSIGAQSKFNDSKPEAYEEIIATLSEICGLC